MAFSRLKQPLRRIRNRHRARQRPLEDVKALSLLPSLGVTYLPWSGAALHPSTVAMLLNEIVLNQRSAVIECGAGISTLMMAKVLADADGKLVSIDHNADWLGIVERLLQQVGIPDGVVQLIHAPMHACSLGLNDEPWYDENTLRQHTQGRRFDMLVVDGPEAWHRKRCMARYPALPFFRDQLAEDFSAFLDDVRRPGERAIMQLWADQHELAVAQYPERGDVAVMRPRGVKRFTIR